MDSKTIDLNKIVDVWIESYKLNKYHECFSNFIIRVDTIDNVYQVVISGSEHGDKVIHVEIHISKFVPIDQPKHLSCSDEKDFEETLFELPGFEDLAKQRHIVATDEWFEVDTIGHGSCDYYLYDAFPDWKNTKRSVNWFLTDEKDITLQNGLLRISNIINVKSGFYNVGKLMNGANLVVESPNISISVENPSVQELDTATKRVFETEVMLRLKEIDLFIADNTVSNFRLLIENHNLVPILIEKEIEWCGLSLSCPELIDDEFYDPYEAIDDWKDRVLELEGTMSESSLMLCHQLREFDLDLNYKNF